MSVATKVKRKRSETKAKKGKKTDPRQLPLMNKETGEEFLQPFTIPELDEAYLKECQCRKKIASMQELLKELKATTNEILEEEMENIEKEYGEGGAYPVVNDDGILRSIKMYTPEPRRRDTKCHLIPKEED